MPLNEQKLNEIHTNGNGNGNGNGSQPAAKAKKSRKPTGELATVERVTEVKRAKALKLRQEADQRKREIVESTIAQTVEEELIRHRAQEKAQQLLQASVAAAIESDDEILEAEIQLEQSFDDLFDGVAADFFGASLPQLSGR